MDDIFGFRFLTCTSACIAISEEFSCARWKAGEKNAQTQKTITLRLQTNYKNTSSLVLYQVKIMENKEKIHTQVLLNYIISLLLFVYHGTRKPRKS